MISRVQLAWILFFIGVCSQAGLAQKRTVAITLDDLPVAGTKDPIEAESINRSIIGSLDRHNAPGTAFVIEKNVQEIGQTVGEKILRQWVQHGHELGNHSFSHSDFDQLTVAEIEREIVSGEKSFGAVLREVGKQPRYFRFPMNHAGETVAKHGAVASFLLQRGYTVATCTIDNTDYLFNRAYLVMLSRKDTTSAERLRAEYLAYTSSEIDYYSNLNTQVFGYEPPQVMLLHANRLNADTIEQLLTLFEAKQYTFVSLEKAQSDPAFRTPDNFVSQYGPMWGYRWAAERHVRVDGKREPEPPKWILSYTDSGPSTFHRYQKTDGPLTKRP